MSAGDNSKEIKIERANRKKEKALAKTGKGLFADTNASIATPLP